MNRMNEDAIDDEAWDLVAEHLETFLEAWENSPTPPSLHDHVPQNPGAVRNLVIVELIKADLEYRQENQKTLRTLSQYAEDFPEANLKNDAPADLIFDEFRQWRSANPSSHAEVFLRKYPEQAEQVRELLKLNGETFESSQSRHFQETQEQTQKPLTIGEAANSPLQASQTGNLPIEVGQTIDDFDLISELGKGGFASVYLARQNSMQRLVALKVSADEGTEPQTLAQFDHPFIVRVFDQHHLPERKLRLLYMQYCPGGALHGVISRIHDKPIEQRSGACLLESIAAAHVRAGQSPPETSGPLRAFARQSWPELVCRIGAKLARALDYAHKKGVLHRDIKPANVLLSSHGEPKLADFNISFSAEVEGDDPQQQFGGSLAYMSLEQLEACSPYHSGYPEDLDERSDLYSLGVTLWELLEGKRPFAEDVNGDFEEAITSLIEIRRQGLPDDLDAGREPALDDVAGQLKRVLRKCLEPDPNHRIGGGEELARELTLCLQPAALGLLRQRKSGIRSVARSAPLMAVLCAALIPNAAAGIFNFAYNRTAIVTQLATANPEVQSTFWNVQLVINLIAFPLGVAILAALTWPVAKQIRAGNLDSNGNSKETDLAQTRSRALTLGRYAAVIGVIEWIIAGFAYPLSMKFLLGEFDLSHQFHFLLSLTLCGLVAASYPFFFVSGLSLRVFYPALLKKNLEAEGDDRLLDTLRQRSAFYLLGAGVAPALGVLACVFFQLFSKSETTSAHSIALVVFSLLGAFGFAAVFGIYRRLNRDLSALQKVVAPAESEVEEW